MRPGRLGNWQLAITILYVSLGPVSCADDQPSKLWPSQSPIQAPASSRKIESTTWDTIATLKPAIDGGLPQNFVALRDGFAFYDPARDALLRFDAEGRQIATWHGALEGHNAIDDLRDLRVRDDGSIAMLDARRAAIVIMDSDWKSSTEVLLQVRGRVEQFLPEGDSGFLLWLLDKDTAFVRTDARGIPVEQFSFPWPVYQSVHPLARTGLLAAAGNGDWAFAFSTGPGWLMVDDATREVRPYIEAVPFPAVVERVAGRGKSAQLGRYVGAASSIVVTKGLVHILFGGKSTLRGRVIDRYRAKGSAYEHSIVVPSGSIGLSERGGSLFLLTSEGGLRVITPREIR